MIQAKASTTSATTSERRIARNARLTDKASVVLPEEATAALFLIPAVSIRRNFCKRFNDFQQMMNQLHSNRTTTKPVAFGLINLIESLNPVVPSRSSLVTGCVCALSLSSFAFSKKIDNK